MAPANAFTDALPIKDGPETSVSVKPPVEQVTLKTPALVHVLPFIPLPLIMIHPPPEAAGIMDLPEKNVEITAPMEAPVSGAPAQVTEKDGTGEQLAPAPWMATRRGFIADVTPMVTMEEPDVPLFGVQPPKPEK